MVREAVLRAIFAAAALLAPQRALAHLGEDVIGGFAGGFVHPILGPDHLLAMLAVGIWSAQMGGRAVWSLPVVFPLIMAAGGALGVVGLPMPSVEPVIAV